MTAVHVIGAALLIGSALTLVIGWIIAGARDSKSRQEAEVEADTDRMLDETLSIVRGIGADR